MSFLSGLATGGAHGARTGVEMSNRRNELASRLETEDLVRQKTSQAMDFASKQSAMADKSFDQAQEQYDVLAQAHQATQNDYVRSQTQDALTATAGTGNIQPLQKMFQSPTVQQTYGTTNVHMLNPLDQADQQSMRNHLLSMGVDAKAIDQDLYSELAKSNLLLKEDDGSVFSLNEMLAGTGTHKYLPPEVQKAYEDRQAKIQALADKKASQYAPGTIEKDMEYMKKLFPDMGDQELFDVYNQFKNPPKADTTPAAIKVDVYQTDKAKGLAEDVYKSTNTTPDTINPAALDTAGRQKASAAAAAIDKALDIKWSSEEEKTMRDLLTATSAGEAIAKKDPKLENAGFADNLYNQIGSYLGFGDQFTGKKYSLIKNQLGHALYGSQFTGGEQSRMTETYGNLWETDKSAAEGMLNQLTTLKGQIDTIRAKSPESFNLRYGNVSDRLAKTIDVMSSAAGKSSAPSTTEIVSKSGHKIGGLYNNQEVVNISKDGTKMKLKDGSVVEATNAK